MGFAAQAGLFFWGGKGAFCPQKGCNAPSAGYGFPIGGPVEKMSFFQIVHMTKVSTQIHSSISQYDVYRLVWATLKSIASSAILDL